MNLGILTYGDPLSNLRILWGPVGNFENIRDHFVILRGSKDKTQFYKNWGTRLVFRVDPDFQGFGVRSSTEIGFSF